MRGSWAELGFPGRGGVEGRAAMRAMVASVAFHPLLGRGGRRLKLFPNSGWGRASSWSSLAAPRQRPLAPSAGTPRAERLLQSGCTGCSLGLVTCHLPLRPRGRGVGAVVACVSRGRRGPAKPRNALRPAALGPRHARHPLEADAGIALFAWGLPGAPAALPGPGEGVVGVGHPGPPAYPGPHFILGLTVLAGGLGLARGGGGVGARGAWRSGWSHPRTPTQRQKCYYHERKGARAMGGSGRGRGKRERARRKF